MKTWNVLTICAATLALTLAAGPSRAGVRPYALTLSPFVGGYNFDDDLNLDDELVFGLALGFNLTERWALEGAISYISGEDTSGSSVDNVDVYDGTLNALFHFRPNRALVPFATIGLGAQSLHPGGGDSDDNLLLNYGVGLKYFLTDDLGLRADVRHIYVNDNDAYYNLSYTLGLIYQFGGDRRDLPPTPPSEAWDADGDGVHDRFDRCPGTPRGVLVDGFGCGAGE